MSHCSHGISAMEFTVTFIPMKPKEVSRVTETSLSGHARLIA